MTPRAVAEALASDPIVHCAIVAVARNVLAADVAAASIARRILALGLRPEDVEIEHVTRDLIPLICKEAS